MQISLTAEGIFEREKNGMKWLKMTEWEMAVTNNTIASQENNPIKVKVLPELINKFR